MHKRVTQGKVVALNAVRDDARETAEALMELAAMAAMGRVVGVAYTVINGDGETEEGVVGGAAHDTPRAHLGACRLADRLRWPANQ